MCRTVTDGRASIREEERIASKDMRYCKMLLAFAWLTVCSLQWTGHAYAQINTDRVMLMGRNALYYEDYVLAIQRFNMVINAKPWLGEPYFFRGLAKYYLEDYTGAEIDCTSALERNPYLSNNYELRALCRINQSRYQLAEEDYRHVVEISPMNRGCWHNMVLCQLEQDAYERADSTLDLMIARWPKEAQQYTLKAQVAFARKDTLQGEQWVDRALQTDSFEGNAWAMKAMLLSQRMEYKQAEQALDRAIFQSPRNAPLYVNRALTRYNQDNLRGAMSDYDTAVELDAGSYLAHFNRGLLRASVGEDNLAIEDFNFVLEREPDNMIALYNRALLLDNTGDYHGAIRDISAVIKEYPQFWEGYRRRASIRRKVGDVYGAERDEFKVLQAQMAVAAGTYKAGKTRKQSDRTIEDYNKLVEEDEHETEHEYASEYRGKVQNRHAELRPQPVYVLTYYRQPSQTKGYVAYCDRVDSVNAAKVLPHELYLTNDEASLTEDAVKQHFAWIDSLGRQLQVRPDDEALLLHRALDYYHVRDFENAIADLNALLQEHPARVVALMLRAQARLAQLESGSQTMSAEALRLGRLMVLQDYSRLAELAPDVPYVHYNKGHVQMLLGENEAALVSFTESLRLDSQFPDAYFNRGVAHLLLEQVQEGLSDLSQAGEYGLYHAYNLIKRYSVKK